jgi:hypothetical protein
METIIKPIFIITASLFLATLLIYIFTSSCTIYLKRRKIHALKVKLADGVIANGLYPEKLNSIVQQLKEIEGVKK